MDDINFGEKYLKDIDDHIKTNLGDIKCEDVINIYNETMKSLKKWRGTSTGFTGLSEYIIFRFIGNMVGGLSEPKPISISKDQYIFSSLKDPTIQIAQSPSMKLDNKRRKPDIVIYKTGIPLSVIQLKLYITSPTIIENEIKTFKRLMEEYDENLRIMIVIFGVHSTKIKQSTVFQKLENTKTENPWFNYVILNQYPKRLLSDILKPMLP